MDRGKFDPFRRFHRNFFPNKMFHQFRRRPLLQILEILQKSSSDLSGYWIVWSIWIVCSGRLSGMSVQIVCPDSQFKQSVQIVHSEGPSVKTVRIVCLDSLFGSTGRTHWNPQEFKCNPRIMGKGFINIFQKS